MGQRSAFFSVRIPALWTSGSAAITRSEWRQNSCVLWPPKLVADSINPHPSIDLLARCKGLRSPPQEANS